MPYSIYDHVEKSFVYDKNSGTAKNGFRDMKILSFETEHEAEVWKSDDLAAGNYYNRPHTVYEIKKS